MLSICFYPKGQVLDDDESLFTYNPGETFANFSKADHVPIFLDQIDSDIRAEAEEICGGSNKLECIFDYSQTKNRELALDTQIIMEQNELNKQIASEYRRKISISIVYKII